MSHHLFLLSPSDTPLYSLTHFSAKPAQVAPSPLSANLPSWSTSAFAGTLTALSGASSVAQSSAQGGGARMGGGQDRHVIQMIANASLDVIEEVVRRNTGMSVFQCVSSVSRCELAPLCPLVGTSRRSTSSTSGPCLPLLPQAVSVSRAHGPICR